MKRILSVLFRIPIMVMVLLAMVVTVALAQGEPIPAVAFPIIFIIPYALGVAAHWFKKYKLEGMALNFFQWIIQNFSWTLGSLVAGWTAVYAMYALNPAAFDPANPGSWIMIFTTAIAADTINSAGGMKPKQE